VTLFLVLFGLLCACVLVLPHASVSEAEQAVRDEAYMRSRMNRIVAAQALLRGEEARTIRDHEIAFYFYVGALGNLLGETRPELLLLYVQIGFALLCLAVYPLLLYKLTGNIWAALASPFLADLFFNRYLYATKIDTQWMMAWVIFAGIPFLLLLLRYAWEREAGKALAVFLVTCLIIAVGNVVRGGASLPVVILLLLVTLYKLIGLSKYGILQRSACFLAACALVFVAWGFLNHTMPRLLFASHGWQELYFGPWHTMFIGLGWETNPYGIVFEDAHGFAVARSVNPEVQRYSEEYFAILKARYFELILGDPVYFLGNYFRKFLTATYYSFASLLWFRTPVYLMIVGYVNVLYAYIDKPDKASRRIPWSWIALCVLSVFLSMATPLMARPFSWWYLTGTYAGCQSALFWLAIGLIHRYVPRSA